MLKHIFHLMFFAAGVGVGIWWGVNHPVDAAHFAEQEQSKIQQAVALAKKQLLQKVVADQQTEAAAPGKPAPAATHLNEYKQMLNSADQEFNNAKASQASP